MKKILVIIYLCLLAFLLLDHPTNDPLRGVSCDTPSVTVLKGDTIWDIAATHCGGERDADIKVDVIRSLNNDVVLIDTGMVLVLPQQK